MPPLGHCGHLGQWAGGQSNCPPPPHGHCKQQGQWAASYQGQWNNYCEGMATNHHGHANWDGPGGCCRGSIQAGWASGFGVGETNIQGEKMPATTEELQEQSSRSKADIKTQQRVAKKTIEFEAEERKKKGMPPHKVEVTKHGKIDGSCDVEAERISVDHVAHIKPSDGSSAATQFLRVTELLRFQIRDLLTELSCLLLMGELCGPPGGNAVAAHLTGMHSAIKMLNSRIRILHHHLVSIQKGEAPYDHSLLRQVCSLIRRLPAIDSSRFQDDFLMEHFSPALILPSSSQVIHVGRRICISTLRIQLWSLRCLKTCELQSHQLQVAGAIIVFICGSSSYSS
ncbi:unnamed protein product [Sphagnum compactum]